MDLIDLEDESIDAEVMDSLAVSMDNFRVSQNSLFMLVHLGLLLDPLEMMLTSIVTCILYSLLPCEKPEIAIEHL